MMTTICIKYKNYIKNEQNNAQHVATYRRVIKLFLFCGNIMNSFRSLFIA